MCSDTAISSQHGRCTFCNMGCRLGIEQFAPQQWRPRYDDHTDRVCARGQMVADLLQHADRIYRPRGRNGEQTMRRAMKLLADRLTHGGKTKGRLTLWLDGNVAIEDLAACRAFAAAYGDTCEMLVHFPPWELGAVEGLDAAEVPPAAPLDRQDADAFLIIGNPLVTHPAIAGDLLRWGNRRHHTPVVVVDSIGSVTTAYASDALIPRPGYEYWVVASLLVAAGLDGLTDWLPETSILQRTMEDSGVELERVSRAATKLRTAQHPAVLVAPQSGGTVRWRAVTALAAAWARGKGGTTSVLTGSANALAVARYTRKHQIPDWTSSIGKGTDQSPEVLLIVGWDPSQSYPAACWESAVRNARHVVWAGAFPPGPGMEAGETWPLAMGTEAGGTYLFADGDLRQVPSLLPPPSGVLSVRELFMALGEAVLGRTAAATAFDETDFSPGAPMMTPTVPEPPAANGLPGRPVVLTADATQYGDGQLTRRGRWSVQMRAMPELRVSQADAEREGLRNRQVARIENPLGHADVRVVVDSNHPDFGGCYEHVSPVEPQVNWGSVSGTFAEVRRLAAWNATLDDEDAEAGLIRVRIRPTHAEGQPLEVSDGRG